MTFGDNVTVTGNLTIGGTTNFGDFNITNVGSIALDTITNDGTDITLDSSGDIILDAAGNDVLFKAGGTTIGEITNSSSDLVIKSSVSDKDILIKGNDGGAAITALTFDMSAAGAATFNNIITAVGTSVFTNLDISGDVDVDGTLETDALTIGGVTLAETISDTVGAMVSSNTETGITVSYEDGDNTLDFALGAAQTTITSLLATDIKIGEDDQTKIDFETANEIHFYADNAEQVFVSNGVFGPQTDSDVDLGTTGVRFKDAFIDTVTTTGAITSGAGLVIADAGNIGSASDTDAIAISSGGVVTMNQIPVFSAGINVSGGNIAGTLSTAAQANITSLGTLTTLTVDNIITNGTTIGHTDDTDLITLADGIVTVAGEVSMTTLDIGGTNVTSTAAELNFSDGVTSNIQTQMDTKASTGKAIAMAIVFG